MAKHNLPLSGRSKVRILFIDGDFAAGDLEQLTQTLSNAVRAPQVVRAALANPSGGAQTDGVNGGSDPDETPEAVIEAVEDDAPEDVSPRKRAPRAYPKPNAVEIDFDAGGKPWKEFASEKAPTSQRDRYLVAAAWLHEYAEIKAITADHVFTCYVGAGWNFRVVDPTAPFRLLKKQRMGTVDNAAFSINHLGIGEVNEMGASG